MAVTHSLDLELSSSQYAYIADASQAGLDITGDITIEAWIKVESISGNHFIVAKDNPDTSNRSYAMYLATGPTLKFEFYDASANRTLLSADWDSSWTGQWVHVAYCVDVSASNATCYVNGESQTVTQSLTGATSIKSGSADVAVGVRKDTVPDGYFDGMVRNCRVWDDIRTQSEIRANMNVDTPADTTNMQANWLFNNAYTDSSANGNTLTATGSPVFATDYPDALDLTENGSWSNNHKITIDNTLVSGSTDLIDFPILLTESNLLSTLLSGADSAGADLRFSEDIDGKQRLAHEVVSFDGSTAVIFVKINTLSYNSDTDIYVHWGNGSASALNRAEAFGMEQVWYNYTVVYHLQEAVNTTAGGYKDSTLSAFHATGTSMALTEVTGKFGKAQDFDGSADYIKYAARPSNDGTGTIQAWFNPDVVATTDQWIVTSMDEGSVNADGPNMRMDLDTNSYVAVHTETGGSPDQVRGGTSLSASTWYLGHVQSTGSAYNVFLNGSAESETITHGTDSGEWYDDHLNSDNLVIATGIRSSGAFQYFNGQIQEVRITTTVLSSDWIATEYNNMNSPSTFATPISNFTPRMVIVQ